MPYKDLKAFIAALRSKGELVEIAQPAAVDQEIACAADRVSRLPAGGPALLFTHPVGPDGRRYDAPVLINALGSEKRLCLMAGTDNFEGLRHRLAGLLDTLQAPRRTLVEKLKVLPTLGEIARFFPKHGGAAPCQEVVATGEAVDLDTVPILKTWPEDGGRFITFPLCFTHSPADGKRNCGMYRIQQFDKRTCGFHVHTHHTAASHMRQAKARGQDKLPVAVAIGGPPAITFAAVLPLPPGLDEMILAGFLQGKAVRMVRAKTVPIEVPAEADYVIEGWIHMDELRREGPFGDHTGFYSLADDYPTLHVTAITRRRDPVYFATVVGPPPQEDAWMARAIERLFLPLMQQPVPEVLDYRLPFCGVAHNLMFVKIAKHYPGQARKVAHAVWGLGQAMFTKVIVVLDQHGPDVHDEAAVARFALERLDVVNGLEFVLGPTETLDHATRALHFGSKLCLDLTRPLPGEPGTGTQGKGITSLHDATDPVAATPQPHFDAGWLAGLDPDIKRHWLGADNRVLVLELEKTRGHQARAVAAELFRRSGDSPLPLTIVLQPGLSAPGDLETLAWAALVNIDPERDLLFDEQPQQRDGRWVLQRKPGRLVVDATRKDARDGFARDWPEVQRHPAPVLKRVQELLRAAGLEMPTTDLPQGS
ncbi:MAG: menaquinone biosynthesis decarboxylase [Planctomycetes bacterium]|nr:menaquinone biosynthesis decarboxylase [Planctomycetota bacterium]